MISIYKVHGDSMLPRIKNGDYIVGSLFFIKNKLKPGQVIIFDHPDYGRCIKTIQSIDLTHSTLRVAGENSLSTSQEAFGDIPFASIKAKMLLHLRPTSASR